MDAKTRGKIQAKTWLMKAVCKSIATYFHSEVETCGEIPLG
jgi:hypothetical protein